MSNKILYLMFVLCVTGNLWAATINWTGGASDNNWNNAANWDAVPAKVPGSADIAALNGRATMPIIAVGQTVGFYDLILGRTVVVPGTNPPAVITMNGGTFQVGRYFKMGQDAGSSGTFDMYAGDVDISGTLMVAQRGMGTFNMYGGTVDVVTILPCESATKQGTGTLNLYDGIINANVLTFYSSSTTTPLVNITQGTLVLLGDQSSAIETAKTAGFLKAYNGNGTIQYSVAGGYTTVTAIPEPATILLLGLGGLMFGKRRKQRI